MEHRPPENRLSEVQAVTQMHAAVTSITFPDNPGNASLRGERDRALRLLESYALPRMIVEDAAPPPLVVVVGGPTGAGKSTLTNSVVGSAVTQSGVMRPTTRQPVMVYNPADTPALHRLGLVRSRDEPPTADASRWVRVRAVSSPDIAPGLAMIDSPDLDSRVDGNRELAANLLTVADLWLFVTTGTDYADLLSWDLLARAGERRMALAVVLNRLRHTESEIVRRHFASLLTDAGLGHAHVFALPEVSLVEGRIPVQFVLQLQSWLQQRVATEEGRAEQIAQALDGTLGTAVAAVRALADGIADRTVTARRLRVDLEAIFSKAREEIRLRCADASLISDDLVVAWRASESRPETAQSVAGRLLRRVRQGAPTTTAPDPLDLVTAAMRSAVAALVRVQLGQALFRVAERWSAEPAVAPPGLTRLTEVPEDLDARVDTALQEWLTSVSTRLAAADGTAPAHGAPPAPATTSAAVLAVATLAVEGRPARGTSEHHQVVGVVQPHLSRLADSAATALAREAWLDLLSALNSVMLREETRLADALDATDLLPDAAARLHAAADAVTRAQESRPEAAGPDEPDGPDEPGPKPQEDVPQEDVPHEARPQPGETVPDRRG